MDLVTVSIPIYNAAEYVEKSLLSALNQTYKNIEYLLVDDKGTDNSMAIVEDIIRKHPRGEYVKIIEHPRNLGTGAARNSALESATGDFLFFMDSDDEITHDCIYILYHQIKETGVDLVCGSYDASMISRIITDKKDLIYSYFDGKFPMTLWNKLYKVQFLRENDIKCIPHQTFEDNYFSFQVVLAANSLSLISDITYYYTIRPDSVTRGGLWPERIFEQCVELFEYQLSIINKYPLNLHLKIKLEGKLFWFRVNLAEKAIKGSKHSRKHVQSYLRIPINSKYITKSPILLIAFILSKMPYGINKLFIFIHHSIMNLHIK